MSYLFYSILSIYFKIKIPTPPLIITLLNFHSPKERLYLLDSFSYHIMRQSGVLMACPFAAIGISIAVYVVSNSILAFSLALPLMVFCSSILNYALLSRRFNQTKYLNLLSAHIRTYQIFQIAILIFNLLSLLLVTLVYSEATDNPRLIKFADLYNGDNIKSAFTWTYVCFFISGILSILNHKLLIRLSRLLSMHYLSANVRVYTRVRTSQTALYANLIKLNQKEFQKFKLAGTSCIICAHRFTLSQYVYRLKCKHVFHSTCFCNYLNAPFHNYCPECIAPF